MAELPTFVQRTTNDVRIYIQAYEKLVADADEYAAMGGGTWTAGNPARIATDPIPGTDFTVGEIDYLMAKVADLRTWFNANAGGFFQGSA